ncbi:putative cytosol aminopeptidase [Streptomyces sp. enrichment culture]|uniref:leucyl aminopeptidase n=1 Tax=Streptomyces xiamenensis TaxID=408015 RepID=UPI0037D27352
MTALTLSKTSATAVSADALVIGIVKGEDGPAPAAGVPAPAGLLTEAAGVLATLGAKGGKDEITRLPAPAGTTAPLVIAVGLGSAPQDGEDFDPETLRRAAGAAARALSGTEHAAFALPVTDAARVAAVAEGALLGAYAFTAFRKTGEDDRGPLARVTVLTADAEGADDADRQAAIARAQVLATEVARTRDLVNTPPNALTPADFAAHATEAAAEHGLSVEVLDEAALREGGFGGILGVGVGSQSPPRLVRVAHTHPEADRTIALVGKGITYDSGGISLKPAGHNETMKCDMAGAAAVLSTVVAAARLGLKVNITGWLALAENMPSGSATRPGDVLRMYGGKTVEVLNTDAEGRLVMADALVRAGEESPDAIVDVATLTGAMMLALGKRTFAVMGNDDTFRGLLHDSARRAGEQSWEMPLLADLAEGISTSTIADLKNMGERMGGGLVAGLFLKEFVPAGTPWAHLDIAGPAFNEGGAFGYTPKGGTGSAVRTLLLLAERAAAGELAGQG